MAGCWWSGASPCSSLLRLRFLGCVQRSATDRHGAASPPPARGVRRPPPNSVPLCPEQELLLEVASDGDLVPFKRVARMMDGGRGHGRVTEAVEAVIECTAGAGALHLAAGQGELAMCRYLVEELRVDINAIHDGGKPNPPRCKTPSNFYSSISR